MTPPPRKTKFRDEVEAAIGSFVLIGITLFICFCIGTVILSALHQLKELLP